MNVETRLGSDQFVGSDLSPQKAEQSIYPRNNHRFPTSRAEFALKLLFTSPLEQISSSGRLFNDFKRAYKEYRTLSEDPVISGKDVQKGNGRVEILVPGFLASSLSFDIAMTPWLKRIGYEPVHLPLIVDRNIEPIENVTERMLWIAKRKRAETGRKVGIIGWSRGGYAIWKALKFHRQEVTENVENVAILGAPPPARINANIGWLYYLDQLAFATDDFRHIRKMGNDWSIPDIEGLRITLIVSKGDGVVEMINAPEQEGEYRLENASHFGMPVNPEIYKILSERLANPIHLVSAVA